ncbi:hypothetical protein QQP08_015972 [Theobroma cacao]|nr:hypothetical protein QQP08_015972 [Theobroma cacao]
MASLQGSFSAISAIRSGFSSSSSSSLAGVSFVRLPECDRRRSGDRRNRLRMPCRAMVQQAVHGGAPATYAKEMERLSAKESLLLAKLSKERNDLRILKCFSVSGQILIRRNKLQFLPGNCLFLLLLKDSTGKNVNLGFRVMRLNDYNCYLKGEEYSSTKTCDGNDHISNRGVPCGKCKLEKNRFKDAGGFEALVTGKTTDMQRIDVNERITGLERLNPTPRPTTSPFLEGRWNFEWFGFGSPGLSAAKIIFERFPSTLAKLPKMDLLLKDGYAKVTAHFKLLNSIESKCILSTRVSIEGPLRMKEEYVEGILESPTVVEETIPEQLKSAYSQAVNTVQQLPVVIRDAVASGLRVPLSHGHMTLMDARASYMKWDSFFQEQRTWELKNAELHVNMAHNILITELPCKLSCLHTASHFLILGSFGRCLVYQLNFWLFTCKPSQLFEDIKGWANTTKAEIFSKFQNKGCCELTPLVFPPPKPGSAPSLVYASTNGLHLLLINKIITYEQRGEPIHLLWNHCLFDGKESVPSKDPILILSSLVTLFATFFSCPILDYKCVKGKIVQKNFLFGIELFYESELKFLVFQGGTFQRLFMISYLDEEILLPFLGLQLPSIITSFLISSIHFSIDLGLLWIIRDAAGIPEVLTRLDPPSSTMAETSPDYES